MKTLTKLRFTALTVLPAIFLIGCGSTTVDYNQIEDLKIEMVSSPVANFKSVSVYQNDSDIVVTGQLKYKEQRPNLALGHIHVELKGAEGKALVETRTQYRRFGKLSNRGNLFNFYTNIPAQISGNNVVRVTHHETTLAEQHECEECKLKGE